MTDKQRALQLSDMAKAVCALKGGKECFGICGGCLEEATTARKEDMAAVGESLMEVIAGNQEHKLLKDWAPINDPAEIVTDLLNAYDELASELGTALRAARQFIRNGVEFGYISMPDPETPDSAHDTLPMIEAALSLVKP
ncbi:hypothetical protein J2X73_002537 [Novosphingobium sp. 1748]|uniref:hypothetical protein n=1 Tax=Novosphingobium sp. 1748 TaxID=2817760 RepID=UPI0028606D58|nr:hypothetical protein [Novosphingobium sp. 1748]MDR6708166.1 hypothetical protein [Novosphingobium sp. 1748]